MSITWMTGEVPEGLEVRQVYGIIFDWYGRILLKVENGIHNLIGGKPEECDSSYEDTLRRELLEEVNCTATNLTTVGYQLVDEENGTPPYAQIRMTGIIGIIGDSKPDDDKPWCLYGRVFAEPIIAASLLGWGQVGVDQICDAFSVAESKFGISSSKSYQVINEERQGVEC